MNERDKGLRKRVVEHLRFAVEVSQKVARIRNLFKLKLSEHPLTTWSPTINDFRRREIYAYEGYKLRGEFGVGDLVGSYDLTLYADGTDLANSQIEVFGSVGGVGQFKYELPPVANIMRFNRSELDELLVKINYLESLLKLIGLLPDEQVDSEEDPGRVIHLRSPRNPRVVE
ncbi:MAG: hypothetical protein AAB973_02715 [Patescibacteria group bacterium]